MTFAYDMIRMNGRRFPEWGDIFTDYVTDYQGNKALVCEPAALALYPMGKTINDTSNAENKANSRIAKRNNENVNIINKIVYDSGILDLGEVWRF